MECGQKIDLLVFFNDDAYGWLVRIERYFCVAQIDECDRLELVLVTLEGDALTWFEMVGEGGTFSVLAPI